MTFNPWYIIFPIEVVVIRSCQYKYNHEVIMLSKKEKKNKKHVSNTLLIHIIIFLLKYYIIFVVNSHVYQIKTQNPEIIYCSKVEMLYSSHNLTDNREKI